MTRSYTLKRRADQQAETRRRIVEAAVALHSEIGPARTSYSLLAEKAGVQRHTLYAHFPDEMSLMLACSAHHLAAEPPPEAGPWAEIADPRARLRAALRQIYGWYEHNADLIACVLRDAEHHPGVREVAQRRLGPFFADWAAALGAGEAAPARAAMLDLALSFHSWRTLARAAGLGTNAAADTMAAAVESATGAEEADPARSAPDVAAG